MKLEPNTDRAQRMIDEDRPGLVHENIPYIIEAEGVKVQAPSEKAAQELYKWVVTFWGEIRKPA